jgi:CheY-like chemotaxis protein
VPASPEGAKVLLIADNLSTIELIQILLTQRPEVKLVPAMQGRLGLDLAREHHPRLILVDLPLPDVQGDEILRLIQADSHIRDIPVVVMSADASPRQIDRLLAAGAQAYLTKPVDVKKLLAATDEALSERKPGHTRKSA